MAVSFDIVATYRVPRKVIRRMLDMGENEGRALAILMGASVLMFVAQLPRLSREAFLTGQALQPLMGAAMLSIIFFLPLVFYAIALLSTLVLRRFGWAGTYYAGRLVLFWAFLASSPLALLRGLVAGFVGPGPSLQAVDFVWVAVFLWFWISGLREAGQSA